MLTALSQLSLAFTHPHFHKALPPLNPLPVFRGFPELGNITLKLSFSTGNDFLEDLHSSPGRNIPDYQ